MQKKNNKICSRTRISILFILFHQINSSRLGSSIRNEEDSVEAEMTELYDMDYNSLYDDFEERENNSMGTVYDESLNLEYPFLYDSEENAAFDMFNETDKEFDYSTFFDNYDIEKILIDKDISKFDLVRRMTQRERTHEDKFDGTPDMVIKTFIVGGTESVSGRYPYMCDISQGIEVYGYLFLVHSCGCTLIAPNTVLTAAHCSKMSQWVQTGKTKLNSWKDENKNNVQTFKVIQKRSHPNFNKNNFNYDVMILKLDKPSSSDLATLGFSMTKKQGKYTILGWGKESEYSETPSDTLLEAKVNYLETYKCKQVYGSLILHSMFCAHTKGKDACQGDSGGPIIKKDITYPYKDIQIGITSWGYRCGVYPGVYADLSDSKVKTFLDYWVCHPDRGFSRSSDNCKGRKLTNVV